MYFAIGAYAYKEHCQERQIKNRSTKEKNEVSGLITGAVRTPTTPISANEKPGSQEII